VKKELLAGLALVLAFFSPGCRENPKSPQTVRTKPAYTLPSKLFLRTEATRGPEGEIYIHGSTNLPHGLNIELEVTPTKVYGEVTVQNGSFTSTGLMAKSPNTHFIQGLPEPGNSKYIEVPFLPGRRQIHFHASFAANTATRFDAVFQRPEVIMVVGEGGKNLRGEMFKETDPDVIDSPRVLDYSQAVEFPPLTPEAEAINLVKRAALNVPGMGKSSTDIDQNVQYYMSSPGIHRGPGGWTAKLTGNSTYDVSFDLITDDSQGHHQAIWSANLATRQVKIVNMAAKYLSWTPNY
jgi:hypothetical protein